jgi:uncharacterized C2H2 Zn-finger protein
MALSSVNAATMRRTNSLTERDYFDISLDEEIKATEDHLEKLRNKNIDAVFHCPRCKKDFRFVVNYNQLKMCGRCYVKAETTQLTVRLPNGEVRKLLQEQPVLRL